MNFDISVPDEFMTPRRWGGACVVVSAGEALALLDNPDYLDATKYNAALPREIGEFRGMRVIVGYGLLDTPLIVHMAHSELLVRELELAMGQAMAEATEKAILGMEAFGAAAKKHIDGTDD